MILTRQSVGNIFASEKQVLLLFILFYFYFFKCGVCVVVQEEWWVISVTSETQNPGTQTVIHKDTT